MSNNQADDRYNPPGIGQNDFDEMRFDEIEVDDLFWMNTSAGQDNAPYRRLDEKGMVANTRTGIVEGPLKFNQMVYMRS